MSVATKGHQRSKYNYLALSNLALDTKVNVYGVVHQHKPTAPCTGIDYFKSLSIYDDSLSACGRRLQVTIFAPNERLLPDCFEGDIIRLHRLHVHLYNGKMCGKLQMAAGGAWVVVDGCSNEKAFKSASSSDPTWSNKDDEIVSRLRQWISTRQVNDSGTTFQPSPVPLRLLSGPANNSTGAHSLPAQVSTESSWLSDLSLDRYACIRCQLLQKSFLADNINKVAILTVWDGTKPRLKLNTPNMEGFMSDTHECGVIRHLPDLCVPIVVYGDHILRAKQLKLGAVYRFFGVHCKLYQKVGLPELYLHERNRVLASPASLMQQDKLVMQLISAVDKHDNIHLDIVSDTRTKLHLDEELARQRAVLSNQFALARTAAAPVCTGSSNSTFSYCNKGAAAGNAVDAHMLTPNHAIAAKVLYANLKHPFIHEFKKNHSYTASKAFVGELHSSPANTKPSHSSSSQQLTVTPLGFTVMPHPLAIAGRFKRGMAVPVVRLKDKPTKRSLSLNARLMKHKYENHLFQRLISTRRKQHRRISRASQ